MTDVTEARRLARDFDITALHADADPYPVYEALRSHCPVAHSERYGGFWVVSDYAGVQKCARDTATFTSTLGVTIPFNGLPLPGIPMYLDPPEHSKYRSLMQPWFSRAGAAALEPMVRERVVSLIEDFRADGHADLAPQLADQLPAAVVGMMLGLDRSQWNHFGELVNTMFRSAAREEFEAAAVAAGETVELLGKEIANRQVEPRDDMISKIAHLEIDGERISHDKMLGMAIVVLGAGYETTVGGIGTALLYVSRDRELRERLIARPGDIPAAVEEVLRHGTPVHGLARTLTQDATVGDTEISEGEKVMLLWASANRDAAVFENPDEFIVDRPPGKHVAFGYGIHRCLGAPLARLEMVLVLEEMLRRIPDFQIDESQVKHGGGASRWVQTLPATW